MAKSGNWILLGSFVMRGHWLSCNFSMFSCKNRAFSCNFDRFSCKNRGFSCNSKIVEDDIAGIDNRKGFWCDQKQ